MTLTLYLHPLSSFCHKGLIALYENGVSFESRVVNPGDEEARARFLEMSPFGKIPVLRDERRDRTILETSIIIEYVDLHYPGAHPMLPEGDPMRLDARLWDRLFDLYVNVPLQKIVIDRLRSTGEHDPRGVSEARATLRTAYDMIERHMAGKTWAVGESFSIADCAAAPALFYAGIVEPFSEARPNVAAYFERLLKRPSFARTLAEARPYFHMFPFKDEMPARFLGDEAAEA
jgi:glutathione S-transferase